jgi:hypothetical protein
MSSYLYDTPWWLVAVLALAGAAFAYSGFSRRDRPLTFLGLVLLVAGVGLFVVSRLVETDREQVVRRTTALIAAVEKRNWSDMESYLDPAATASVSMIVSRQYQSRDEIMADARRYVDKAGSFGLNVQRVDVKEEPGGQFAVEATVYIAGDQFAQLTVWRFRWRKDGANWTARSVDLIQTGLQPGGTKR